MDKGIVFPESLETLLVSRALGDRAAAKAASGYLSATELSDITSAMLELSDRFNGIDAQPLGPYMQSRWHRAAYYLYFLPANYAKARAALSELAPTLAGKDSLSILDVGSGPGSLSLGALDFLAAETPARRLRLTSLDSSREALSDWQFLMKGRASQLLEGGRTAEIALDSRVVDISFAEPPAGPYDIIFFGDSLNELFRGASNPIGDRARLLGSYARALSPGGSLVVIEPALKDVTRALQAVRDILPEKHGLHIYAPCLRQGPCPMLAEGRDRDWCHTAALWMRPRIVKRIDEVTGRGKFVVKFSYIVARPRGGYPVALTEARETFRAVGDRMTEKGKTHALLCGERTYSAFTLLKRDASDVTAAFSRLYRGDIVSISEFVQKGDGARLSASSEVALLRRFSCEP